MKSNLEVKQMLPLIGSDPEFMVAKQGHMHHAIGMVGGTKDSPLRMWCGAVQEDNVLLEVNTIPTDSAEQFEAGLLEIKEEGAKLLKDHGVVVTQMPSFNWPLHVIKEFPKSAFVFGCDPDFSTYTGKVNPAPVLAPHERGFRCAGGHLHIGWDHIEDVTRDDQLAVGQMCDMVLGLWGVVNGDDLDRRKLYGKAGSIRFKDYGIEYRTLGNFWTFDSFLTREAHRRATLAYQKKHLLPLLQELLPVELVINTINTCETAAAIEMINEVDRLCVE